MGISCFSAFRQSYLTIKYLLIVISIVILMAFGQHIFCWFIRTKWFTLSVNWICWWKYLYCIVLLKAVVEWILYILLLVPAPAATQLPKEINYINAHETISHHLIKAKGIMSKQLFKRTSIFCILKAIATNWSRYAQWSIMFCIQSVVRTILIEKQFALNLSFIISIEPISFPFKMSQVSLLYAMKTRRALVPVAAVISRSS